MPPTIFAFIFSFAKRRFGSFCFAELMFQFIAIFAFRQF